MQALAAGRLEKSLKTDILEQCLEQADRLCDLIPWEIFVRIEVENNAVRKAELVVSRTPGVNLEHTHLQ